MNLPSDQPGEAPVEADFEMTLEDGEPTSESPAKPARVILVVIPKGVRYRVDVESVPGATCLRIPVEGGR